VDPTPGLADGAGCCSTVPVPSSERNELRWNGNPFVLDGGSGFEEEDPGAYLSAYWLGRAFGIIV
jgi:hypothetical protein